MRPDPTQDRTGAAQWDNEPTILTLTKEEVTRLVLLVSMDNPELYDKESTKSLIYKCKSYTIGLPVEKGKAQHRQINFDQILIK